MNKSKTRVEKSDQEWQEQLTADQYRVCRQQGTEHPFTGEYWDCHDSGLYQCVCCGADLFASDTKFDSGTGWPSFWQAVDPSAVDIREDVSHGMVRAEVTCRQCGAHLGHLFPDGPQPTGQRFCINSASLNLRPK